MTKGLTGYSKLLFSLFLLVVGITILIPALIIMLLAVSLIVIADELFTKEIKHIIKWNMKK